MKLSLPPLAPRPLGLRFFLLFLALCVLAGVAIDRWLGGTFYGYFVMALGLLPWIWDKARAARDDREEPATLVGKYLQVQRAEAQVLPIREIFGDDRLPDGCDAVRLADIYVPMDVAEIAADAVKTPEFRRLSLLRNAESAVPVTRALAEGIARNRRGLRAVLVGEAGSGKSSVVAQLLHGCGASGDAQPDDWPQALRDRVALRLDLRRLAEADLSAVASGSTKAFWRAVREDLCTQLDGLAPADRARPLVIRAVELLQDRLRRRGLLLLDGLDELLDEGQRGLARDLIEALSRGLGAGCALLVTARPYVYPKAALRGFRIMQLQPLSIDPGHINQERRGQAAALVANWHRALLQPPAHTRAFLDALHLEPGRAELATRPLLLTLLVALGLERAGDHSGVPLPADRAALLDEATRLFVRRWLERIERDAPKQIPAEIAGLLSREVLRETLQDLSLEVQRVRPEARADGGDVQIEVSERQFLGAVVKALPKALYAQIDEVGRLILHRAGILFDRGGDAEDRRYGYAHRLFQEYLAACELVARHHDDLEHALGDPLRASPGAWREVARFVPVHLAARHGAGQAIDLILALLGDAGVHPGPTDGDYQAVAAAGQALVDLRLALEAASLTAHQRDNLAAAKRRFDAWLLRLVDDPSPTPATRLDIGRSAGRLGDPRPGILPAAWTAGAAEPCPLDPDLDFDWVAIPAGPFRPGSDQADLDRPDDDPAKADPDELNPDPRPVQLPAFEIARYPVTQAQFAAFTRGGGYGGPEARRPPPWWRFSDAAEDWWHGGNPGLEQVLADPAFSEEQKGLYRQWVEQRARSERRRPWFLADPSYADWVLPNHPVIGISWFEAMAFCGWLSVQAKTAGEPWTYRLPSEIEWERAARGAERRRWPWGQQWRPGAANTGEAGLSALSAAGLFPLAFPDELRDAAGNLWEWTRTRWGPRIGEPAFGWPLDPGDGRGDPTGADLRVVKGGAWLSTMNACRGACRFRDDPNYWYIDQGFRVVRVSLA